MPQEISAAGPAATTAFFAPYSQPDPMIEPAEAQSSPISPTFRRRELWCWPVLGGASWSTDAMGRPHGVSGALKSRHRLGSECRHATAQRAEWLFSSRHIHVRLRARWPPLDVVDPVRRHAGVH